MFNLALMMGLKQKLTLLAIVTQLCLNAQNTIGLLQNTPEAYNGYTLFPPIGSDTTYLIDNCGRRVHMWPSQFRPANSAYLLPDGSIARPVVTTIGNQTFGAGGGVGGRVEKIDWDGNLTWGYNYADSVQAQHHDIATMPNGNVLMLVWKKRTAADAIAAGRDSAKIFNGYLWDEAVVEVQPTGDSTGNVVWEWHFWDHVIQDIDSTKPNYGNVATHAELLDFNYLPAVGNNTSDWLHFNSIDYNPQRDEILISSKFFSEIYVVDHSTTTAEAAAHAGGNKGKGGDLLCRWGNPEVYRHGSSAQQQLFGQHSAKWIPPGSPNAGKVSVFNNGVDRPGTDYSTADIIDLVDATGNYVKNNNGRFLPDTAYWHYEAPVQGDFYDNRISSVQELENGNVMICSGTHGKFFEVQPNGTVVWQYVNPVTVVGILAQGATPALFANSVFMARKISPNHPGLSGRVLTPGTPIEKDPSAYTCEIYSGINELNNTIVVNVYPNPSSTSITVNAQADNSTLKLISVTGAVIYQAKAVSYPHTINVAAIPAGVYILQVQQGANTAYKKVIVVKG